ncbi:hypothetical protein KM043_007816 [Ampulex compressa]|nr:hypothetical protein KM043_007816 [Ampulex compressa]
MDTRARSEQESDLKNSDIPEDLEECQELQKSPSGEFGTKIDVDKKPRVTKYRTKHMRLYPELYRSDVSIHPSYTTLKNLPYYIVCRRRVQRIRKQINHQLNREIMHFAMMQMFAIDSVRIDRIFSIGMSPKTSIVPDFASEKERRRINELLRDT